MALLQKGIVSNFSFFLLYHLLEYYSCSRHCFFINIQLNRILLVCQNWNCKNFEETAAIFISTIYLHFHNTVFVCKVVWVVSCFVWTFGQMKSSYLKCMVCKERNISFRVCRNMNSLKSFIKNVTKRYEYSVSSWLLFGLQILTSHILFYPVLMALMVALMSKSKWCYIDKLAWGGLWVDGLITN